MDEFLSIGDLYASIAGSMDKANRQLERAGEDTELTYAITELDISVPFKELVVEGTNVGVLLPGADDIVREASRLRFSVRLVPRAKELEEEKEEEQTGSTLVPELLNEPLATARTKISEWGLELGKVRYSPRERPSGHIVSQHPLPYARVNSGSKVDLVVAGKAPLTPNPLVPPEKLEIIEGIGAKYAQRLGKAGIASTLDLLTTGKSPKERENIAQKTGIGEELIWRWVNLVDLSRISGIGVEYAELIYSSGIETVADLAQQNPAELLRKMTAVNKDKRKVRRLPTEAQTSGWIEAAQQLPRIIEK